MNTLNLRGYHIAPVIPGMPPESRSTTSHDSSHWPTQLVVGCILYNITNYQIIDLWTDIIALTGRVRCAWTVWRHSGYPEEGFNDAPGNIRFLIRSVTTDHIKRWQCWIYRWNLRILVHRDGAMEIGMRRLPWWVLGAWMAVYKHGCIDVCLNIWAHKLPWGIANP